MRGLAVALLCLPLAAQDAKKAEEVDPKRVDEAIRKGIEFLRTRLDRLETVTGAAAADGRTQALKKISGVELVLWTFVHAGVPETDEDFRKLFAKIAESELESTYNVSLQAMILEELDRVKHQDRILQCAQFLVDNQARNGQWSYGASTTYPKETATGGKGAGKDTASGGGTPNVNVPIPNRAKPKVERRRPVKKNRDGPAEGDNSNAQYAMLGLRACHDAGIVLPEGVVKLAEQWWRKAQKPSKSGYGRGWGYRGAEDAQAAYGSMTAGALGGLVICDYLQGRDWKKDRDVVDGVQWIALNFAVDRNPGGPQMMEAGMLYYWLYALERAGVLFETETFGRRRWYPEGARFLLKEQKSDGSWTGITGMWADMQTFDTCFALLFLRRATRPLKDVASVDRKEGKP
jgi:hypothetical protein